MIHVAIATHIKVNTCIISVVSRIKMAICIYMYIYIYMLECIRTSGMKATVLGAYTEHKSSNFCNHSLHYYIGVD